jgi:hypothetical protein
MALPGDVLNKIRISLESALIVDELGDFCALGLYATAQVGICPTQVLPTPVGGPSDKKTANEHGRNEREREIFYELVFPGIGHGENYIKNFFDSPLTFEKNMR